MPRHLVLTAATLVALAAATARADTLLQATLNTFNEPVGGVLGTLMPTTNPGNQPRPFATGTATMVLNDAQTAMTFSATVNGIDFTGSQTPNDSNDNLLNAHIHAGQNFSPTGNVGVVWGFHGSPFHDNMPNDVVVTPFAAPGVGGTITAKWDAAENSGSLATNLSHLLNRRAYVNFHTVQFGGGEVRGTIVPEPSSIVLVGVAVLGGLAVRHLRRRRAA